MVLRRGGITEIALISVIPPLLNTITQGGWGGGGGGGFTLIFFLNNQVTACALATHRPIWGHVAQGALELFLPQIRCVIS